MSRRVRTGVWLVGGRGSVATTAMVGAAAIAARAAEPIGMATAREPIANAPLPAIDALVFGGQDIVTTSLVKRAEQLADGGVVPSRLLTVVADHLARNDARVVTGKAPGSGTGWDAVHRMRHDLDAFRTRDRLEQVVVINVASTEPPPAWQTPPADLDDLDRTLHLADADCPPSLAAAVAALESGCAFVDFTPGAALGVPAILSLATERALPVAGRDGKTGETLLKTVLAPMFADRALTVRSWAGTNLLGGGDGARLGDPIAAQAKLQSKGRSLDEILDNPVTAPVHIDCVPDLGEWKTAWDHVHFEGFLGTGMTMQVTWQGCDSALAAPLILDLARLAGYALERGDAGPLAALGFYFKDPVASDEHRFSRQVDALRAWVQGP